LPAVDNGTDGHAQEAPPSFDLQQDFVGRLSHSSTGTAQEQHLAALGVDRWHGKGLRGQQVKVAILDSGFQGY
jgi:hypothetical protein